MGNLQGSRPRGLKSIIRLEEIEERAGPLLREWEGAFRQVARLKDRDDIKNGRIRRKDFDSPLLYPLGFSFEGENPFFRDRTFRAIESNEGGINFEDFCLAALILSPQGLLSEKLKLTFRLYNPSGSGYVEPLELYHLVEHLDQTRNENSGSPSSNPSSNSGTDKDKSKGSESSSMGSRVGSSASGGNKMTGERQIQLPPGRSADIVRGIFDRFDKNQDLKLSYLEFSQFLEESPYARTSLKSFVDPNDFMSL